MISAASVILLSGALLSGGANTIDSNDVKAAYPQMFGISVHQERYVATNVSTLDSTHPLAGFVTDMQYMLEYLLEHGRSFDLAELKPLLPDTAAFSREFQARLANDPIFDRHVLALASAWLKHETGSGLSGWQSKKPDVMGLGRAMLVGSRFFYLSGTKEGRYSGHICTGINGFKEFPGPRDIMLESFVFSAILHDLMKPRYQVSEHFAELLREARDARITAGVEDAAAFMPYARTVIWERMTHSPRLQDVLLHEYRRVGSLIPFRFDM